MQSANNIITYKKLKLKAMFFLKFVIALHSNTVTYYSNSIEL